MSYSNGADTNYLIFTPNDEAVIKSASKLQTLLDSALAEALSQRVASIVVLEKHHKAAMYVNVPHVDMVIFYDPLDSEDMAVKCDWSARANPSTPMFYVNHNGNGWTHKIKSSNVMSFPIENEEYIANKIVAEYPNLLVKCAIPTEEVLANSPSA